MATITPTSITGSGSKVVTITTLTASDTFTYVAGAILQLNNVSGGALTPNIVGNEASAAYPVKGAGTVDLSGGYDVPSVGIGEVVMIPLDSIKERIAGVIEMTGADAMAASILTF